MTGEGSGFIHGFSDRGAQLPIQRLRWRVPPRLLFSLILPRNFRPRDPISKPSRFLGLSKLRAAWSPVTKQDQPKKAIRARTAVISGW